MLMCLISLVMLYLTSMGQEGLQLENYISKTLIMSATFLVSILQSGRHLNRLLLMIAGNSTSGI